MNPVIVKVDSASMVFARTTMVMYLAIVVEAAVVEEETLLPRTMLLLLLVIVYLVQFLGTVTAIFAEKWGRYVGWFYF